MVVLRPYSVVYTPDNGNSHRCHDRRLLLSTNVHHHIQPGVCSAGHLGQCDRATQQWSSLAHGGLTNEFQQQGFPAEVRALAMVNGFLYVGGVFDKTSDLALDLNNIARYNLTT